MKACLMNSTLIPSLRYRQQALLLKLLDRDPPPPTQHTVSPTDTVYAKNTQRCTHTQWTGNNLALVLHSHANRIWFCVLLCLFFLNVTQVPWSLFCSDLHTAVQFNFNNILPLYSNISCINYSRAEWTSKRDDERSSSYWNQFTAFV